MAFIWRIEDKKGVGMYQKCDASTLDREFEKDFHLLTPKYVTQFDPHPSADEDPGLCLFWIDTDDRDVWYFGYNTLVQARNWIGSLRMCTYMAKKGLHLVKYHMDIEHYQVGEFQAIFKKKYSLKTETRKLSSLFS